MKLHGFYIGANLNSIKLTSKRNKMQFKIDKVSFLTDATFIKIFILPFR